jgi:hypothetical protein
VTNFRVTACIHLRTIWEIGTCIEASCECLKRLFEIQTLVGGKIMSVLKNLLFVVSAGAQMPLLGNAAVFSAGVSMQGRLVSWRGSGDEFDAGRRRWS